MPNPGSGINQLYGVSASSATDVWAVGTTTNVGDPRGSRHALALHFDGASWTTVPVPGPVSGSAILRSVAAIAAIAGTGGSATVWVAGYKTAFVNGAYSDRTLALRGTGS